ncbi:sterol desaturase family protein [Schleiferiaceae bacterium]|mgnify:CR=1 FL=1|jgi:beta-carotene 3-hydroxylase|nr:sterol desaturase family protein [Schleiferiaceae bacterium]MDA9151211.1 sterol desaturase family protein [Schleiferiaceae bacterium]
MMIPFLFGLAAYVLMEGAAWAAHKYLMHGPLWFLHEDHHTKDPGFFEKNDYFFLIFAIPSWLCIMLGMIYGVPESVGFGFGIAAYGLTYFLVHELFIHQRFRFFQKTESPYWKAVRLKHKMHHKTLGKEGAEHFGLLWVPLAWIRDQKKAV